MKKYNITYTATLQVLIKADNEIEAENQFDRLKNNVLRQSTISNSLVDIINIQEVEID
jgi:hypothetical protein